MRNIFQNFLCLLIFSVANLCIAQSEEIPSKEFSSAWGIELGGSTLGGISHRMLHSPTSASKISFFGFGVKKNLYAGLSYDYEHIFVRVNRLRLYTLAGLSYVYAEGTSAHSYERELFGAEQIEFSDASESALKPHFGLGAEAAFESFSLGVIIPIIGNFSVENGIHLVGLYPGLTLNAFYYF